MRDEEAPDISRTTALARVIDAKLSLDWAMLKYRWAVADAAVAGVPVEEIDEWAPRPVRW